MNRTVPVIDLFAGPGGLGEGFSAFRDSEGDGYRVVLSIEKERYAHKTLELRAFYREFTTPPLDYYKCLRQEIQPYELYQRFPSQARAARRKALATQIGPANYQYINQRITTALQGARTWVLIGGPPCQAYSLAGRSRNKAIPGYTPERDQRHYLYREYLRILAMFAPPLFVMENVKGLVSSRLNGANMFRKIIADLASPARALKQTTNHCTYEIISIANPRSDTACASPAYNPLDFVIRSERYGIPQSRHRVIVIGVRHDIAAGRDLSAIRLQQRQAPQIRTSHVIGDLPRIRSALSKEDSPTRWKHTLLAASNSAWFSRTDAATLSVLQKVIAHIPLPRHKRGGEFIHTPNRIQYRPDWYHDDKLQGVCNHTARAHIPSDLHRYLFAASFASAQGRSPLLRDFPQALRPQHRNITQALKGGLFADRFRVQLKKRPCTTVTSHIAKDGHYYIHYDPTQCRSLTVREAARLQTFPDNYFFCGPRTAQYIQVGNAVPPLLATQIAETVWPLLR